MTRYSYLSILIAFLTALYVPFSFADTALTEAKVQQSDTTLPLSESLEVTSSQQSLLSLLQQSSEAWRNSTFDVTFVKLTPSSLNSYQYRHLYHNGIHYAQLFSLDGIRQEIIQRGDIVSYFGTSYQPFSIKAAAILDNLPSAVYADYAKLNQWYNFINAGKTRVANRIVQVIKIMPKDDFRHQYVLWIDTASHLILRSDMLDRNGNLLEQFRVTALQQSDELKALVDPIEQLHLPPILEPYETPTSQNNNWKLTWLPPGFEVVKRDQFTSDDGVVDSVLYSDGLFSFSLYVNNGITDNLGEHFFQQETNTIYTRTENQHEITLIGEIPLITAKQIVQDFYIEPSKK